jgi:hypothetical protein
MSKAGEKTKNTPQDLDLRVRERNLATGVLEQKTVDKHLADLPDLSDQADTVDLFQPALGSDED